MIAFAAFPPPPHAHQVRECDDATRAAFERLACHIAMRTGWKMQGFGAMVRPL